MTAVEDWDTVTVSLDGGESLASTPNTTRVELVSRIGDTLTISVDGGSTGAEPAQYTMTVDRYSTALDDWMEYKRVTTTTKMTHEFEAPAWRVRVNITNTSGGSASYRAEAVSETYSRA